MFATPTGIICVALGLLQAAWNAYAQPLPPTIVSPKSGDVWTVGQVATAECGSQQHGRGTFVDIGIDAFLPHIGSPRIRDDTVIFHGKCHHSEQRDFFIKRECINNETGANASVNRTNSNASGAGAGTDDGYPEQKHAGAVGYGPEYNKGATTGDKIEGLKEEVKGKILRKPDVVEHGRELRTGELKKKQQENDSNPFDNAKDDKSEQSAGGNAGLNHPPSGPDSSEASKPNPADKGAREQAATTAPEGTEKGERQKSMGNTDKVAYIG
ncbi:hypothetical protein BN946_scf184806.g31 [Trametes cinnabarina]|uniref:Uncharacterized protein n=1 Tax=Pycnoporus cinnabarinus TaxID=5643 RepID=A0A060SCT8_PYCCI|nr:hypothetical protein BN946_scf184806.g31 [Trametes cinnabarina]